MYFWNTETEGSMMANGSNEVKISAWRLKSNEWKWIKSSWKDKHLIKLGQWQEDYCHFRVSLSTDTLRRSWASPGRWWGWCRWSPSGQSELAAAPREPALGKPRQKQFLSRKLKVFLQIMKLLKFRYNNVWKSFPIILDLTFLFFRQETHCRISELSFGLRYSSEFLQQVFKSIFIFIRYSFMLHSQWLPDVCRRGRWLVRRKLRCLWQYRECRTHRGGRSDSGKRS